MSSKSPTGDFASLVQLAHKTFRNCQKAGKDYLEIACEVRCLHSVLRILRSESQKPKSKIFTQNATAIRQLLATAYRCRNVLDNLDYFLAKYEGIKIERQASASRKIWQKFRIGSKTEDLGVIRGKLATYTSILSILIDTVRIQATDKAENKIGSGFTNAAEQMSSQFERMRKHIYTIAANKRAEERRGGAVSRLSLSTYTRNEKAVWRGFRKELVKKGFQSTSLERHKHILQAYMLKLNQSGLLDQDGGATHNARKGKPGWVKQTEIEKVKSGVEGLEPEAVDNIVRTRNRLHPNLGVIHNHQSIDCNTENQPPQGFLSVRIPSNELLSAVNSSAREKAGTELSRHETPHGVANSTLASSSGFERAHFTTTRKLKDLNINETAHWLPLTPRKTTNEVDGQQTDETLSHSIVSEWLRKDSQDHYKKQRPTFGHCEVAEKVHEKTPVKDSPSFIGADLPPFRECESFSNLAVNKSSSSLSSDSSPKPPAIATTTTVQYQPVGDNNSRNNNVTIVYSDLNEETPPFFLNKGTPQNCFEFQATGMAVGDSISIDSNSTRSKQRDSAKQRISPRTRRTLEQWDELKRSHQDKVRLPSTIASASRPHSMPPSPIIPRTPKLHQLQSPCVKNQHHSRSRSTPISYIPPTALLPNQSKVHYRGSITEIVDFPIRSTGQSPSVPRPRKGILKTPTERFPEDPNPEREGVAAQKDAKIGGIPPEARWTEISRKQVNPEALKIGNERYEVRGDVIIVLRVLGKEDIEGYFLVTQKIRETRKMPP